MTTRTSVLIVGAGPTGMTAALVLARSGIPCRIIDKRPTASGSSRALGLQARSMEVLAGLGVTAEIEAASYRLRGSSIMRGHRTVVQMDWVPPDSRFPHTYVLPQAGLEEILRRHLSTEGIEVERGVELLGVEELRGVEELLDVEELHSVEQPHGVEGRDASGVRVRVTGGEELRADWLLGADGGRSTVRASLGIGFPERATGETYHLADAILDLPLDLGDAAMWLGPEGPLMLMRLPGDQRLWRVFADVTESARSAELPELDAASLSRLLQARGPAGTWVRELRWASVFHTRIALADSYRRGRVLLAGDAAHLFPPFGGQGMNLGIQDAVAAAWRIASIQRGAEAGLMESYETERRPVAARVITDVEARRRMYALRHPLARAGRDLLLALGGRSARAARSASEQNSQLAISYADRTPGGGEGPRPRPGDRAPHAGPAGSTTHELFGPDHATLLLFEGSGPASGPIPTASASLSVVTVTAQSDADGQVRARYGVGPGEQAWVLVRPDGHVAGRGTDPSAAHALVTAVTGTAPALTEQTGSVPPAPRGGTPPRRAAVVGLLASSAGPNHAPRIGLADR